MRLACIKCQRWEVCVALNAASAPTLARRFSRFGVGTAGGVCVPPATCGVARLGILAAVGSLLSSFLGKALGRREYNQDRNPLSAPQASSLPDGFCPCGTPSDAWLAKANNQGYRPLGPCSYYAASRPRVRPSIHYRLPGRPKESTGKGRQAAGRKHMLVKALRSPTQRGSSAPPPPRRGSL